MPSSLASSARIHSVKGKYRNGKMVPDFLTSTVVTAAATFTGANTGVCVLTVPAGVRASFLGGTEVHTVAGNNPMRIQVIRAASTAAPGAAAATNIEDMTAAIPTTPAANTPQNFDTSGVGGFYNLEAGDRVCIASALQNTGLAGSLVQLRFVWI